MSLGPLTVERRRHSRYALGVPVRFRLDEGAASMFLELVDVSAGGGCFRAPTGTVRVGQHVAFGFVMPHDGAGDGLCVARARVVRTMPGLFAVVIERSSDALQRFLDVLETGAV
jgi:hypothetical protein